MGGITSTIGSLVGFKKPPKASDAAERGLSAAQKSSAKKRTLLFSTKGGAEGEQLEEGLLSPAKKKRRGRLQ